MEALIAGITQAAVDFGMSVALLLGAVWWFNRRETRLLDDMGKLNGQKDDLQKEMRGYIEASARQTSEALNANTVALNSLRDALK